MICTSAVRYRSLIYDTPPHLLRAAGTQPEAATAHGDVHTVMVQVASFSEELSLNTNEKYTLMVSILPWRRLNLLSRRHAS